MAVPISRVFLGIGAIVAASTVLLGVRHAADPGDRDNRPTRRSPAVEVAARRFLTLGLLPAWVVPGFADYLCHRRAKIERTSGTHESLTHQLMLATTGIGVLTGLFCEINAGALAIMAASAFAHEGIVLWDVGYAARLRPPSATEQHVHSFLEVLPFAGLAVTCCLYPDQLAALLGRRSHRARWRLERKRDVALAYDLAVIASIATFVVAPNIEEFVRCYRVDPTLLPHARPIDGEERAA